MDILLPALFVIGMAALAAATIGSLKRDRDFRRRYQAASESERRDLEKVRASSLSWTWVTSHLKSKWAAAMYAFFALVLGAAWCLQR